MKHSFSGHTTTTMLDNAGCLQDLMFHKQQHELIYEYPHCHPSTCHHGAEKLDPANIQEMKALTEEIELRLA